MNKMRMFNLLFEKALYGICGIVLLYHAIFTGRYEKCFQAVLIITVLLIIRYILKWTKTELPSVLQGSILIFITLTMLIANLFNMYAVIPYLDKIEHLLSGVILCFLGLFILRLLIRRHKMKHFPVSIAIWFAFIFAFAMAGGWEIYEFTVDHLFGLNSQNGSLTDTMWDIICGTVGGALATLYLVVKAHRKSMTEIGSDDVL